MLLAADAAARHLGARCASSSTSRAAPARHPSRARQDPPGLDGPAHRPVHAMSPLASPAIPSSMAASGQFTHLELFPLVRVDFSVAMSHARSNAVTAAERASMALPNVLPFEKEIYEMEELLAGSRARRRAGRLQRRDPPHPPRARQPHPQGLHQPHRLGDRPRLPPSRTAADARLHRA